MSKIINLQEALFSQKVRDHHMDICEILYDTRILELQNIPNRGGVDDLQRLRDLLYGHGIEIRHKANDGVLSYVHIPFNNLYSPDRIFSKDSIDFSLVIKIEDSLESLAQLLPHYAKIESELRARNYHKDKLLAIDTYENGFISSRYEINFKTAYQAKKILKDIYEVLKDNDR